MSRSLTKVSVAIRILQRDRDVSARASHLVKRVISLQAEMGKFLISTVLERNIMSTKTTFKRVALVVAAAVTFGGVSAVASHATASAGYPDITIGSTTGTAIAVTAVTGTYTPVGIQFVASGETAKVASLASTGVGSVLVPSIAAGAGIATTGVSASGATIFTSSQVSDVPGVDGSTLSNKHLTITAISSVAGVQTITVGSSTATITWGAAPTFSAGYSTAVLNNYAHAGVGDTATADDTIVVDKNAWAGSIKVTLWNSNGPTSGNEYNGATVSAVVTGSGLVSYGTSASQSTLGSGKVAANQTALTGNVAYFNVSGDGTAGTGTIAISVTDVKGNTVALASKTVTFTGKVAALKTVANLSVLKAGGTAGTAAGNVYNYTGSATDATSISGATGTIPVTVFTTDANGNKTNAGANLKIVSSDSTVLTAGDCTAASSPSSVVGEYNCVVTGTALAASGATATITAKASTDGGATFTIVGTPVTFTIGGDIKTAALSTDSATYSPLQPITVSYTAKDSSGNAAYDQDLAAFSTVLSSSILLGGQLPAPTKIKGGVGTTTGAYAPASEYTGIVIKGTDAGLNDVSATFDVGAGAATAAANAAIDAANEATDAANAATDAATNAMDSADAAQQAAMDAGDKADAALAAITDLASKVQSFITSITAQISALAAAVAKIKSKVKA